jgi:hypothetical protein
MENEKSVLRWGGLAGILAFIVWLVEMPLYGSIDPFTPEGLLRFTDVGAALGLSTILMMTIAFLSVALVLALLLEMRPHFSPSPQSPTLIKLLRRCPRRRQRSFFCGRQPRA